MCHHCGWPGFGTALSFRTMDFSLGILNLYCGSSPRCGTSDAILSPGFCFGLVI